VASDLAVLDLPVGVFFFAGVSITVLSFLSFFTAGVEAEDLLRLAEGVTLLFLALLGYREKIFKCLI